MDNITVLPFRRRRGEGRPVPPERIESLRHRARFDQLRARALSFEIAELAREFIDDDLKVRSGPREGEPLGPIGRRARLKRLAFLHREYWQARDAESHGLALLASLEPGPSDDGRGAGEPGVAPSPEPSPFSQGLEEPSD